MNHQAVFQTLSEGLLKEGKTVRMQVFGSSMHPTIRSGEFVRVEALGERPPRAGEIVFFKGSADRLLIHRLIRLDGNDEGATLIARGDGFGGRVDHFSPSRVLGRVTFVERKGRLEPLNPEGPGRMRRALALVYLWLIHVLHSH